jgi:hypothetical protein
MKSLAGLERQRQPEWSLGLQSTRDRRFNLSAGVYIVLRRSAINSDTTDLGVTEYVSQHCPCH